MSHRHLLIVTIKRTFRIIISRSITERRQSRRSQVKQSALRVGEDLAVTSGAVVYHGYRDAVCEVIQTVAAY
jgi:hypothetical protein